MLPFELTKDTPYLALSGELWSVFYEYFNRNWSCYKGFLLYPSKHAALCVVPFVSLFRCQWTKHLWDNWVLYEYINHLIQKILMKFCTFEEPIFFAPLSIAWLVPSVFQGGDGSRMLSNQYPDYASPPGGRTSDHSLAADPRLYASSPNSQSLYELDFPLSSSLSSSCGAETVADLSDLSEFDLKPQFECSITDLDLLKLDNSDPTWSPGTSRDIDPSLIKMEDVFQVDQTDATQCPTLAELNGDDSTSIFGDIESIIGKDMSMTVPAAVMPAAPVMATTTCHWKPTPTPTPTPTPSMPIPIARSRMPQANVFATCTVTSPTNHGPQQMFSHSLPEKLPPALYTHIGKLAALPEHSKVRLQGGMTQMARSAPTTLDTSSLHQLLTEGQIKQEAEPVTVTPASPVSPQRCNIPVPNLSVQTVPPSPVATVPQLSSPVKTVTQNSTMEEKWEEIKQFIYDSENMSLPMPTTVASPPKVVPKVEKSSGQWRTTTPFQLKVMFGNSIVKILI